MAGAWRHGPRGHAGAARYLAEQGSWPSASSVARRFGSLHAAVEQAGLAPGRGRG